jgi:PTH1 family peptidyl-tRNA hydrolase
MNLSGSAVKGLLKKYRIDLKDLLVVCDDLDLECGRLKLRPGGSSGGHRGLESIIASFASRDFARLRLGIGRPLRGKDATDYVLSAFSRKEKEEVSSMIERATVCCSSWLTKGTTETMNIFNSRSTKNE